MTEAPSMWIECMGCYGNGRSAGRWFTATDAPTTMAAFEPRAILGPFHATEGHDEVWVTEFEGFCGFLSGEFHPSVGAKVAALIAAIRADDVDPRLVAHWAGGVKDMDQEAITALVWDEGTRDAFTGSYGGEADSLAAWVEERYEELYAERLEAVPEELRSRIDWEGVARDWSMAGRIDAIRMQDTGTLHVFWR